MFLEELGGVNKLLEAFGSVCEVDLGCDNGVKPGRDDFPTGCQFLVRFLNTKEKVVLFTHA